MTASAEPPVPVLRLTSRFHRMPARTRYYYSYVLRVAGTGEPQIRSAGPEPVVLLPEALMALKSGELISR